MVLRLTCVSCSPHLLQQVRNAERPLLAATRIPGDGSLDPPALVMRTTEMDAKAYAVFLLKTDFVAANLHGIGACREKLHGRSLQPARSSV